MPRWIYLFQNSLKNHVDPQRQAQILEGADDVTDAISPAKKAAWAWQAMSRLEASLDEAGRTEVLEACGRQCIGASVLDKARRLRAKSPNLETFLSALNQNHLGGGSLAWRDGMIEASYPRCYCGMVSQTRTPFTATYCNCSRGWFLHLFEHTLGVPVQVTLIQSIIQGAPDCRFRIELPEHFTW